MDTNIYQVIIDGINGLKIPEWKKVVFLTIYTDTSYEMKFYVYKNEKYVDCFSLGIPVPNIINLFSNLDKDIIIHRNDMCKLNTDKWYSMTLVVDENGEFNVEYDYNSTCEDTISYIDSWKKKHL